MAKVVGFSIEIKGQKDIITTTKLLGLLNTQLILINTTLGEIDKKSGKSLNKLKKDFDKTGDSASKLGTSVKSSFDSFEKGNKIVQDLGNGYFEVTKQVEKAGKEFAQLEKTVEGDSDSIKDLIARNKELKKILESVPVGETSEELEELRKEYANNADTIKTFRKELKNANKETKNQEGSIDDLKAQAKALTKEYKALSDAQKKGPFSEGAKIAKSLNKINKEIDRQNKAIRRSGRLGKTLTKTFTKLFIGRSILSAGANAIRSVVGGLRDLVTESDDTNKVFNQLEQSGNRLTGTLTTVGTSFLNAFGSGISKIIDNVAFSFSVVSNAIFSAAEGSGLLGSALRAVGAVFTDFPAIIGGVIEVIGEFRDRFSRTFGEISLQAEKVVTNIKRIGVAITGGDTAEIDRRLQLINQRLAENVIAARSIGDAYREGFDATIAAQEEFNKATDEEVIIQKKRAAAVEARRKAEKQAAEEEKKRLAQLAVDRQKILEEFRSESFARIEIIKELGAELTAAEIENIEDATQQALAAENERFRLEKEARQNNFNDTVEEVDRQRTILRGLFEKGTKERIEFEKVSGAELDQIKEINRRIDEQKEKEHQDNLNAIIKKAQDDRNKIVQSGIQATSAAINSSTSALTTGLEKIFAVRKKKEEEAEVQRVERIQKFTETASTIADTAFSAISQITEIANQAENQRLDAAIENRQASIDSLGEQLADATGLQKKFLQQQIDQEKKALAEETKNKEEARKKQAETQKAIAITQAVIAAALGIANAFALPPPASFVAAAATAVATAVQIATIASQQFARGGVLSGPSHAAGGIPVSVGGANAELEGGEAVINKRSTSMFKPLLSAINEAGGGIKFANGGVLGPPISAPSVGSASSDSTTMQFLQAFSDRTEAISNRVDNITVTQDLNNLQDIQDNDNNLNVMTTLGA